MSTFDSGRRRLLAGIALVSLLAWPARGQATPDCVKSATVGDWEAVGYDDFWTVSRNLPEDFTITVFDTFTTIGGGDLSKQDQRYTMEGTPVAAFAVSVDGEDVVLATAAGFDNFSGSDHSAIVTAFIAGKAATFTISLDNGSRISLGFSLNGFTRAVYTAKALSDQMARLAASEKCEPLDADCFFTAAACGAVGLADDCWELETLRRFRDRTLVRMPHGPADIAEYDRSAPAIIAAIAGMPGARRRLLALYWTCILPCCVLARLGADRACRSLYAWHFARLKHLIANQPARL